MTHWLNLQQEGAAASAALNTKLIQAWSLLCAGITSYQFGTHSYSTYCRWIFNDLHLFSLFPILLCFSFFSFFPANLNFRIYFRFSWFFSNITVWCIGCGGYKAKGWLAHLATATATATATLCLHPQLVFSPPLSVPPHPLRCPLKRKMSYKPLLMECMLCQYEIDYINNFQIFSCHLTAQ